MQQFPGKLMMKTFFAQLALIVLYVVIAFSMQMILFKTGENTWQEALQTHPWLYLVYFAIAHILIERWARNR